MHKSQEFLYFSANKGYDMLPINQIASGGEVARIMLALKSILSNYKNLPTIIFDEIDTGVSGEIATKSVLIKNHKPTKPPCKPIQPLNEPLSRTLLKARTNPKKNKPVKRMINSKKPKLEFIRAIT